MSTQKIKIYDKINNFLFNLELKRRVTIIRGDSATKKSYLADLIRRRKNMLGKIIVESERTIHYILKNKKSEGKKIFIDKYDLEHHWYEYPFLLILKI